MADKHKNTNVFREKSLERVSSPENLDKYIRSTTPSLWLLLACVILILVGALAWATFGKIDSASVVGCKAESGRMIAYIKETDYAKIKADSYIEIEGKTYPILSVDGPTLAGEESERFLLQAAKIEEGNWYYTVLCETDLADGKYKGNAVFEKISPITFIIN